MKLLLVAGPPCVGKTTVIKRIIEQFKDTYKIAYLKIDVAKAYEDDILTKAYGIKARTVYSGDLCPDHSSVVIMKDVINWALKEESDMLIVESAGLCLRCSPYLTHGLGIVILSASSGVEAPEKMGPMVSLADVVVTTRIDLVSQAEKEILTQKLYDFFPNAKIFETNALQGHSLMPLYKLISESQDIDQNNINDVELRGNPPVATCTICVGKKQLGWENHYGVVRKIKGSIVENLYRGD